MTARRRPPVQKEQWMLFSACRGQDPSIFYPASGESHEPALRFCRVCPATKACLDYAIRNGERDGIWGGMSQRERSRYRKSLKLTPVA